MFEPVSSRVNFPQLEENILGWWQTNHIFEQSVVAREGGPRFVLYEGPPTANGSPGIHHVLARAFKDIIPRYRTMKGYHAPRNAGWDTHGLPVELEVEKQLGFTGKNQIEDYGIDRFNTKCRENVFKYLKEWNSLTERIGFWIDLDHPYITMENSYIETVWWALKQMWDKGLIYQGYKVTPHCPRCGTSLSSHEVALGYQDNTEDPSVYVKFRVSTGLYQSPAFLEKLRQGYGDRPADFAARLLELAAGKPVYLLAWTTTPWTLPANTALAVSPDAEYSIVEHEGQYLILATALLGAAGLGDAPVVAKVSGKDLIDLRYEPLFNPLAYGVQVIKMGNAQPSETIWEQDNALLYPVIGTDFVSMEDGTGVVHMAPSYGEVDYQAGSEHGLNFIHVVDLQGMVTGSYPFSGKLVKEADPLVLAELKKAGLLFHSDKIYHTYPFCWRCESPLLYYAKQTWYIRTTAVKEQLISGNREINWYPEHIKYGRFGDWLENNVDWAFSRERFWGTPLPVWRCESCGSQECIGGIDDLRSKPGIGGFNEPVDLHRPYVDGLTFDCSCGGKMRRVPEVIDVWFDSGAMPIAQSHYPFENATLLEDGRFPADYICEAVDQTRGWFYSLHAISTLLFNKPCFRNVICLGHILDAKGEKMSKAKGNVVKPGAVIDKYGADTLRWALFTSSPPGNVRRFSEDILADVSRRFLSTLWNVYSFFVTYANIDNFTPAAGKAQSPAAELDRWIISELNQLIKDVDTSLDGYDPTGAGRKIETFVERLSNWYVRRSRRRFWKSESDTDKLSAYNVLYECLVTLVKLMAPFTPFTAEAVYRNLVLSASPDAPQSVHFCDFPTADESKIDRHLETGTQLAMKVSSLGRAARSQAGIKVRQPLGRLLVTLGSASHKKSLQHLSSQLLEEVNVKEMEIVDEVLTRDWPVASEGEVTVMVDPTITPELEAEGLAREIVHRLQNMRRSAGFDIADHITTYYQGDDLTTVVMKDYAEYIRQETLSDALTEGTPPPEIHTESFKLGGHQILLGVLRR